MSEYDNDVSGKSKNRWYLIGGFLILTAIFVYGAMASILSNYNYVQIENLSTQLDNISVNGTLNSNLTGNETVFDGWDKNASDDITSADDSVNSSEFDNICSEDGKIAKRIGGTWQCAIDQTNPGNELNYTKTVEGNDITLSFYIQ